MLWSDGRVYDRMCAILGTLISEQDASVSEVVMLWTMLMMVRETDEGRYATVDHPVEEG